MEMTGTQFALRPYRRGDEDAVVRHANNRKIWRNMTDRFPYPYNLEDARWWIDNCLAEDEPHTRFAITIGDEVVGGVGCDIMPDIQRVTARAGYWIGETYWGRGIVTEAFSLFTNYVFDSFIEIERVEATVFEWNPASRRVLEKCGFTQEALMRRTGIKDGQIINVYLYARLR